MTMSYFSLAEDLYFILLTFLSLLQLNAGTEFFYHTVCLGLQPPVERVCVCVCVCVWL